ncbi:MAG: hypothetical protein KDH96_12795, partial [Candidatus Riesia sp.]|nr:hypothetical protein [Candidatus Riesia sp.]
MINTKRYCGYKVTKEQQATPSATKLTKKFISYQSEYDTVVSLVYNGCTIPMQVTANIFAPETHGKKIVPMAEVIDIITNTKDLRFLLDGNTTVTLSDFMIPDSDSLNNWTFEIGFNVDIMSRKKGIVCIAEWIDVDPYNISDDIASKVYVLKIFSNTLSGNDQNQLNCHTIPILRFLPNQPLVNFSGIFTLSTYYATTFNKQLYYYLFDI